MPPRKQPAKNQTGKPTAGTEDTKLIPNYSTLLSATVAGEKTTEKRQNKAKKQHDKM